METAAKEYRRVTCISSRDIVIYYFQGTHTHIHTHTPLPFIIFIKRNNNNIMWKYIKVYSFTFQIARENAQEINNDNL